MEPERPPPEQEKPKRPRRSDGKFAPGQPPPPPTARRKKGTPNKFTVDIKRWLTEAAEELGADGKGKDGGKGFVKSVGVTKAEALLAALVRQVPPPKEDAPPVEPAGRLEVKIISVPSGCQYDSKTGLLVYPDGTKTEPGPFVPFTPTPDYAEPAPEPVAVVEPLSEPVVEDDKLAFLDVHRRKRTSDDGSPPAA